ncbi:MAG: hypothetical protein WBO70_05705 [Erysipelotrichaceae bacterium]
MKVEILYPEICNLYGDLANISYLKKCNNSIEVINTSLNEVPHFTYENIDLVYMATTTEKGQEIVIEKLLNYKDVIVKQIENDKCFLFTGNAFEILGKKIIDEKNDIDIDGLGIFNIISKREMKNRYNGLYLGKYEEMEIVGFKSQFSFSFGDVPYWITTTKGCGLNEQITNEGIKYHNFYGTNLLGPLLVINPDLCKYFLRKFGLNDKLSFEDEAYQNYNHRLKEYKEPHRGFTY